MLPTSHIYNIGFLSVIASKQRSITSEVMDLWSKSINSRLKDVPDGDTPRWNKQVSVNGDSTIIKTIDEPRDNTRSTSTRTMRYSYDFQIYSWVYPKYQWWGPPLPKLLGGSTKGTPISDSNKWVKWIFCSILPITFEILNHVANYIYQRDSNSFRLHILPTYIVE